MELKMFLVMVGGSMQYRDLLARWGEEPPFSRSNGAGRYVD